MYYASTKADVERPIALSEANLAAHAGHVRVPEYDRAALASSVVHIGVGGFHRAHQAIYLDDLAASGASSQWGVTGIGLRRRAMKEALGPQDGLYTVVERGPETTAPRIVGSMTRYLFAPEEPLAVLAALADPGTRLVTLTVTGDGYPVDRCAGAFLADDPGVVADLRSPSRPRTAIGWIVEALARRRTAGLSGFTVLSCDNLPGNGRVARTAIVSFARCRDDALADWIEANVEFPSSVVDRITPQTTPDDRRRLASEFGIADRWPVITEPFSQWVVEDRFSDGRPPLEEVGVQFVSDAAPHELVKKWLLNGSHCALGYIGALSGHETVDEAMRDPLVAAYIEALMDAEITPLLPRVEGVDLASYKRTLRERFANPGIGDRLARLCARGSTKMPAYLLPSLREAASEGRPHSLLLLALAGWVRYLQGTDLDGRPLGVEDGLAATLEPLARRAPGDARPLLARTDVFGDLGEVPGLPEALSRTLRRIEAEGLPATLRSPLPARQAAPAG